MATLQKIRNKGTLLVIVIGVALLAFVLGDLFTSGTTLLGRVQDKAFVVNGEVISTKEYADKITEFEEFQNFFETLVHGLDDHVDANRFIIPHVVICYGGQTAVAHSEFSCELSFRYDGHSDDISELSEHVAFRSSREPGAFDTEICST